MRWSKAFIPTLKEDPKDAECVSHKLLVRAGYIRMLSSGIYIFLPLAYRSIKKINQIIRQEMDRIGGQELLMPALNPIDVWDRTGRNKLMGDEMLRVKDRREKIFALAPTHEEIIAFIASGEIRSYKELPQIWYQIQTKFRDEPRPRFGLLRVREFFMKDAYTLAANQQQLDESYQKHREAYSRIFTRCGLEFVICGASSGAMGGKESEEFMVPADAGEDFLAICPKCESSYNREIAPSQPQPVENLPMERKDYVHTPDQRTIDEVSSFLDIPPYKLVKSLLYITEDNNKPVMFLVRGDYDLSEGKAQQIVGACRPALPEEVIDITGAEIGYIGPFGLKDVRFIADTSVPDDYIFATGANKNDYHTTGRTLSELGEIERYDIHAAKEGDTCTVCGTNLDIKCALELGHIFKLGTKYSEALDGYFLDRDGNKKPIIMGSYGIGSGRVLVAAIELYADEDGIVLPISIAPYEVVVTPLQTDDEFLFKAAEDIYNELRAKGVDVLFDDRSISPGVKFKDADLVGFPLRVTLGQRKFKKGKAELYFRKQKKIEEYPLGEIVDKVMEAREKLYAAVNEQ